MRFMNNGLPKTAIDRTNGLNSGQKAYDAPSVSYEILVRLEAGG